MAGRDGTGPMGQGTMSGKGLGRCTGDNAVASGSVLRRGMGRGHGIGLGTGNWCGRGFENAITKEPVGLSDKEILSEQKELLQTRLDRVNKQLESII